MDTAKYDNRIWVLVNARGRLVGSYYFKSPKDAALATKWLDGCAVVPLLLKGDNHDPDN